MPIRAAAWLATLNCIEIANVLHAAIMGSEMAHITISLPEELKDWAETQASLGRYENPSAYVQELIRHDQDRLSKIAALQKLIDEAAESGIGDMNLDEMWNAAKEKAQQFRGD